MLPVGWRELRKVFRATPGEAVAFALARPDLLTEASLRLVTTLLPDLSDDERTSADEVLEIWHEINRQATREAGRYPITDLDPLLTLQRQVLLGEVTIEVAVRAAAGREYPDWYIEALADHAGSQLVAHGWRRAIVLARLVFASSASTKHMAQAADSGAFRAEQTFVWVAAAMMRALPSAGIFWAAFRAGNRAIFRARAQGQPLSASQAATGVGWLALSLYRSSGLRPPSVNLPRWAERLGIEYGESAIDQITAGTPPDPAIGMALAQLYFKDAASIIETDFHLGVEMSVLWAVATLKLPTRNLPLYAGHVADLKVAVEAAEEAVRSLPPELLFIRIAACWILARLKGESQIPFAAELERLDPGGLITRAGVDAAIRAVPMVTEILALQDPSAALGWVKACRTHFRDVLEEDDRAAWLYDEAMLEDRDLSEVNAAVEQATSPVPGDPHADEPNDEELAEQLRRWLRRCEASPAGTHSEATIYAKAEAQSAIGVLSERPLLVEAALGFSSLGLPSAALSQMQLLAQLLPTLSESDATRVLDLVSSSIVVWDRAVGEAGQIVVQEVFVRALSRIRSGDANRLQAWFSAAKSASFAARLAGGIRLDWRDDVRCRVLLARLSELEDEDGDEDEDPLLELRPDDELLLTSVRLRGERIASDSRDARRSNLQLSFDEHLASCLAFGTPDPPSSSLEDLQATLDERTVLVQLFIGQDRQAVPRVTIYTLLTTSEGLLSFRGTVSEVDVEVYRFDAWGRKHTSTPLAAMIAAYRTFIQEDPRARRERPPIFNGASEVFGEALNQMLELRGTGKDHLTIVPHRALHLCPLHLLKAARPTLAEDFLVTYQPSLGILLRNSGREPGKGFEPWRRELVTTVGLSYEGVRTADLRVLPDAIEEAWAIARMFGSEPLLDADATKTRVLCAMRTSRCVHIAAHAAQDAAAPSFQHVSLTPDDDDGRLYAFELQGLDLEGLDLVTLSACETGLGRFDAADNPQGLGATLFGAGVRTLVATLWETRSKVASAFFVTFYASLHRGSTAGDAFADAQREARKQSPAPRDWGAFQLLGDWNVRLSGGDK